MGFWHTGYMEFHEPTGLSWTFVPDPVVYSCAICRLQFDESDKLLRHRFEAHPHRRPMLFVRGHELGATPYRITRAVTRDNFSVHHATDARVNGEVVPLGMLGEVLAGCSTDRVTIELTNESARATFEVNFAIAQPQDCAGVESYFESMVKMKRLDLRGVEDFISNARAFSTATTYLDGICSYLYGVMAKERASECAIPFDVYREKFELAAGALADFDRPLALIIRGLISFHFNQFVDALRVTEAGSLHLAARRFQHLLSFGAEPPPCSIRAEASYSERALSDFDTQRIIRWALASVDVLRADQRQVQELLTADLVEYDRTKMKVLLAEYSLNAGDPTRARSIARSMRNNSSTEIWAESMMTRTAAECTK